MALPGYGARRCQVVLQKALEFEPSLIIMHVNDTNKWEDEREWRRSQEFKGWHPRHWLMKVFIFRRLYEAKLEKVFWPLVPDQIRLKYAVSDADAQVAASKDPEEIAARIRLAQETMVENVALVRRHHIPLLVISQCRLEKDDGQPPHLTDHGLEAMCAALNGPGVYHLSMREVFNGPDFASYFSDSGHLKSQGHRLLAEAISRKILGERANFGLPGSRWPRPEKVPGLGLRHPQLYQHPQDDGQCLCSGGEFKTKAVHLNESNSVYRRGGVSRPQGDKDVQTRAGRPRPYECV